MPRFTPAALSLVIAALTPGGAIAEAPPLISEASALEPARAVSLALELNPGYRAILTSAQRARLTVTGEEARFTSILTGGIDYTRATTTSLNQQGVLLGESDSISGRVGLRRQFAWGTSVSADLNLSSDRREFVSPILNEPISIGPGYSIGLRVTAVQPLLRGLGEEIGLAQEALARASLSAAELSERRAASELARDTMSAFWELWYAERAIDLQTEALTVARRALSDVTARVEAGEAAEIALLTVETDIASLEEALLAAESEVRRRQIAIGRFIGWPSSAAPSIGTGQTRPRWLEPPDLETMREEAAANTPELAELRASVERAEIEARLAADRARPRLDATAWLNLGGLGDRNPLDALSMWAGLQAVTFFVGLDFELPVDRTLLKSEAGARQLAVEEAEQQLERQTQLVTATALELREAWVIAAERLRLAERTATLAGRAAEAQRALLDSGAATMLEWLTAEQEARRARLRVKRLEADLAIASVAGKHSIGRLLESELLASP